MRLAWTLAALPALLLPAAAWPQAGGHGAHHAQPPKAAPGESRPAKAVAAPRSQAPAAGGYRSAFEGYRPFGDEPLRDWRAANEEVRAAGGHIGLMKADEQAGSAAALPGKVGTK